LLLEIILSVFFTIFSPVFLLSVWDPLKAIGVNSAQHLIGGWPRDSFIGLFHQRIGLEFLWIYNKIHQFNIFDSGAFFLMSIPLLAYNPRSQNQRVAGFEIAGDEQPRVYTTDHHLQSTDMDMLIMAAYRQICNEQQMLTHYRQKFLESQLRSQQITVKEFIRGLVLSDSFRRLTYNSNNNYRFVEICVQRVLGRNVYGDQEKIAWSIVLATKGLQGFVDALLNSAEYTENFGDNTLPYQRRRILPQQSQGEVTFAHMARYGTDYRDNLPEPSLQAGWGGGATMSALRWAWQKNPPKALEKSWIGLFYVGMGIVGLLFLAILLGL
jgi:phycobilisome rod-core linker protein